MSMSSFQGVILALGLGIGRLCFQQTCLTQWMMLITWLSSIPDSEAVMVCRECSRFSWTWHGVQVGKPPRAQGAWQWISIRIWLCLWVVISLQSSCRLVFSSVLLGYNLPFLACRLPWSNAHHLGLQAATQITRRVHCEHVDWEGHGCTYHPRTRHPSCRNWQPGRASDVCLRKERWHLMGFAGAQLSPQYLLCLNTCCMRCNISSFRRQASAR